MTALRVHDDRVCALGEGPLWHPERNQLFWFDILGRRLLTRQDDAPQEWRFDEPASAAGWIDRDTLMIATASALWRFDTATGAREPLAALEADDPGTRSNDGRADPQGGFWIGTMAHDGAAGRGAIYRYFRGEVRRLYEAVGIPNAICFAPDGDLAYFADTAKRAIWSQRLDRAGWPSGGPRMFCDFSGVGLAPDGAVCDAGGDLWIAQWGAWRVACHSADGRFRRAVEVGAAQASCPAFGGADLRTMFVTSAAVDLPEPVAEHHRGGGRTWALDMGVTGQAEHRVVL